MEIYRLETTVTKKGHKIHDATIVVLKLNSGSFDLLYYNKITYENRFYINNLGGFLDAHIANCHQKF
jgi:hypothetical protein